MLAEERGRVWGPRRIMWTALKGPCQGGQPGSNMVANERFGYVGKEVPDDGLGLPLDVGEPRRLGEGV